MLLREPFVAMFGGARARLVEVVLEIDDDLTVRHADADAVSIVRLTLDAEPDAIVVFGSVARGDDSAGSDIDLLVVAPDVETSRRWAERSYEVGELLQHRLGVAVDVVVAVRPDLDTVQSQFWHEVLEDGRSLAGASMRELVVEMAT